jgi:hypothetical protein
MQSSGERFQSFESDDVNSINIGRKVNYGYGYDKTRMRILEHEYIKSPTNLWDLKRSLRSTVEQGCWPCLKRLQSLFHRLDLQKAKHLGITSFIRDVCVFNDKEYTQTLQKYCSGASRYKMKSI